MNGSSWDILHFLFNLVESLSFPSINFNHLYSSLKYFCWTNFTNNILDSWIMVVVINVAVTSSVMIFLCLFLVLNFFTNSIISATILTIFAQVVAWFFRTDKTSVSTTIWFTCITFFSSGSSGLMAGVLVLVFHVSSGSQRYFGPRIHSLGNFISVAHTDSPRDITCRILLCVDIMPLFSLRMFSN